MVDANAGDKPLVTITGVTGFLGAQTVKVFLEDGSYRVRGTVRSKNNATKIDPLKKTLGEELFSQLELVEADLLNQESIEAALAGSTFVVHTASPFVLSNPDDENTLVKPAVEGTTAVVKACKTHGVQRCVITSSIAAIRDQRPENWPADNTFDESFWSDTSPENTRLTHYNKSKTLAERAAWDYQASLPESERFDIVTINPALIFGPANQTNEFASGEVMRGIMTSTQPVGRTRMGMVDVRDVAKAHLLGVKNDAAKNKRFLLVERCAWRREMAQTLANEFNPKGWNIVTEERTDDNVFSYEVNTKASREVLGV